MDVIRRYGSSDNAAEPLLGWVFFGLLPALVLVAVAGLVSVPSDRFSLGPWLKELCLRRRTPRASLVGIDVHTMQ